MTKMQKRCPDEGAVYSRLLRLTVLDGGFRKRGVNSAGDDLMDWTCAVMVVGIHHGQCTGSFPGPGEMTAWGESRSIQVDPGWFVCRGAVIVGHPRFMGDPGLAGG
jgi:hypothetical protein